MCTLKENQKNVDKASETEGDHAPADDAAGSSEAAASSKPAVPGSGSTAGSWGERGVQAAVDREVSPKELAKWTEMVSVGIAECMRSHPSQFRRRVRRGIPPRYRWHVWKMVVNFDDFPFPGDYQRLCREETPWRHLIGTDVHRTFPEIRSFSEGPQQQLLRVLNAYAAFNPEVGYCQGMNFVAGLLLLVADMNEEESFVVLARLMDDPRFNFAGFYRERLPLLSRYLRVCDKLLSDLVPELREHFIRENIEPPVYLHPWFLTVFINCFPLSMVMIIWDVVMVEGLPVVLKIAVSILQALKDSLLSMSFEEIIKFFKMMKTYSEEDGELDAFRIGQLLLKHTEKVVIPDRILEYLTQDCACDDWTDDVWEAAVNGGTWFQSLSRMFASLGSNKRWTNQIGRSRGGVPHSLPSADPVPPHRDPAVRHGVEIESRGSPSSPQRSDVQEDEDLVNEYNFV